MIRRLFLGLLLAALATPMLAQTARIRPDQDATVEDVGAIADSTYFVVQLIGDTNPQSVAASVIKAYVLAGLAASQVAVTPVGGVAATDLQAAIQELDAEHTVDTDDQDASEVPFTPAGGLAATDVQAAIEEVDSEHTVDTDDQTAAEVASTATGDVAATDVQAAIAELASEKAAVATLAADDGDAPNVGSNQLHWNNIDGMPAGFADGSDDGGGGTPADAISPAATDGVGAVGVETDYAREDHRHPSQTAANTGSVATGGVSATDVQSAIAELDAEHTVDTNSTAVSKNSGATVGDRSVLNLIEGTGITLTITDDAGGDEVDVTIASTGGFTPNADPAVDHSGFLASLQDGGANELALETQATSCATGKRFEASFGGIICADDMIGTFVGVDGGGAPTSINLISTGDIDFVESAGNVTANINAAAVSAAELDEAGVEAGLEAVLDLQDLQGAVTDAQVPDTITVSNYLPLAGGTLTGALVTDNLGIEFAESDTNPTCAAGDFHIYSDLSEGTLKKCVDGTVSDLDTTGSFTPNADPAVDHSGFLASLQDGGANELTLESQATTCADGKGHIAASGVMTCADFVAAGADDQVPVAGVNTTLSNGMVTYNTTTNLFGAVTDLSGLNTALGSSVADGAHTTDTNSTAVSKNSGATVGDRSVLNLIEGTGITLTIADDAGGDEVDVTIASTGGFTPNADPAVDHASYVAGHGDGGNCFAGEIPLGVDAAGVVQGCYEPTEADISDLSHFTPAANVLTDYATAENDLEAVLDIPDLQGSATDGQVDNDLTISAGTIQNSTIILNDAAPPTQDGEIRWDTTTERIEVGDDGVATLEFYPGAHTAAFTPNSDPGVDHASYVAGHGNGANCSAGNYPLGVDTAGAVESCTADDDVPEAGDFGAATDLDANGAILSGAVGMSEIADDLGCTGDQIAKRNTGDTAWECADLYEPTGTLASGTAPVGTGASSVAWTDVATQTELDAVADREDYQCNTKLDPEADDLDGITLNRPPYAITITEIWCEVDAATSVDIDVTNAGADVNGTDITCTTSGVSDTSFAGDSTVAADALIAIDVNAVTGTPGALTVCVYWTVD